ncbi:O-methyltransferase [Massilibacterium senegalense]|uniref:O-methyltransferase n=1 Tax=Massilibacterium senegalense TaxID=1632858 RepID=UPI000783E431|nr:O-methyltransferase [Massilibacterium senegalense]
MIPNELITYLESLIPTRNEQLLEMEEYARVHHVPIMELVGVETLLQILRIHQPKKILEIGTAIGYSAIRMVQTLEETTIYTIERDEKRYEEAIANIQKANLSDRIIVIKGDALDVFEQIQSYGPFDFLFIDAAKGQYQKFFELYGTLVTEKGIILSDNVLFRGLVAKEADDIESKRLRTLAKKIKKYNEWLMKHPLYRTTILPVGDGIAISIKKGEK